MGVHQTTAERDRQMEATLKINIKFGNLVCWIINFAINTYKIMYIATPCVKC